MEQQSAAAAEWQQVTFDSNSATSTGYSVETHRLMVPGGWLYKNTLLLQNGDGDFTHVAMTTTFVADRTVNGDEFIG